MRHNIDCDRVIELYRSGESIYQIAKKLGAGKSTIHRVLKEHNITTKNKSPNNDHSICEHYLNGNSAISTAAQFNISPSQVYRILKRNNINRRTLSQAGVISKPSNYHRQRRSSAISRDELYDKFIIKKMTASEIAQESGINLNTINYHLRKHKIKRAKEDKALIRSRISKKLWENHKFKCKMSLAIASTPKISSLQQILYSMLDDLDVIYYQEHIDKDDDLECRIGPYSFDCVIPRKSEPWLLIECQGEYWHSMPSTKVKDQQKASYIANHHQGQYELKYLWEHEFSNRNYLLTILKQWLGLEDIPQINFDFDDVEINKPAAYEYKLLLSKYHYLPNAGRGGIAYGAYLKNTLIAIAVFSPLVRQNIGDNKTMRELSRFCIHPSYQKKNFASWFLSRCIKKVPQQYTKIIAYSDTTFGHEGTIYKASNFKHESTIRPDYWYRRANGWVMHKRTLYGKAKAMHMTESEYAAKHGYHKVYGKEKLKFILER